MANQDPDDQASEPLTRGVRVLIVEDDDALREVLELLLRTASHEVLGAASGVEALEALDTFQPEVAIVDIGLPDSDGYELARQLRSRSSCLLFAVSGYSAATAPTDTVVSMFDRHFVKPIDMNALLAAFPNTR